MARTTNTSILPTSSGTGQELRGEGVKYDVFDQTVQNEPFFSLNKLQLILRSWNQENRLQVVSWWSLFQGKKHAFISVVLIQ